jgi:hypothetical protein
VNKWVGIIQIVLWLTSFHIEIKKEWFERVVRRSGRDEWLTF